MELRYKYRFNFFRFINEVFLLTISFILAFYILNKVYHRDFFLINLWMLPLLIIGWYFSSRSTKAADDLNSKTITASLYKIANSIFIQACLVILFFFTSHQTYNSKRFLLFYIILLSILIPLEKVVYNKLLDYLHKRGITLKKILIIGAGRTGQEFSEIITRNRHLGYEIVGFLDDEHQPDLNGQYLGPIDKLTDFLKEDIAPIDEVVVALPNSAHNQIKEIANQVGRNTIKLRIIPAYHELINSQYNVSIFNGFPMITTRHEPLDEMHLRSIKRIFDIIFSLLVLIFVCSWLFPIIAIAIKLNSKGPVLFVQERWGKKNRKIKCYKFRSMRTTSSDVTQSGKYNQAQKNDPRITSVGAFLRKSNLDEFPQFLNVLLGDMSVVGPRPHPTPLNRESKELVDNYLVRHLVKPGITGWAQVNGFRGETSSDPSLMHARVNYDIWYIENWTLLLDLKIIFLTFWKTLTGDKNAF